MNNVNGKDQELSIVIEHPQGIWDATFAKTTKGAEIIDSVKQQFGYSQEGTYQLALTGGETMNPERPIISYQLKDGDHLIFVDLGAAV